MPEKRKTRKTRDIKRFLMRAVIWVIVVMTVLGSVYMALYFALHKKAAEPVVPTAEASKASDMTIRVGLSFGTGAAQSAALKADYGFQFGTVGEDRTFVPLFRVSDAAVSVLCDANMKKLGGTYIKASSDVLVGAYHVQLTLSEDAGVFETLADVSASLAEGEYAFPAVSGGKYALRMGSFATEEEALAALSRCQEKYPASTVVGPSATGLTAVETVSGRILMEYDAAGAYPYFAAAPLQEGVDTAYTTFGNFRFDGFFRLRRWEDKVEVVNYVPIENYIMGVIPYEVSPSWPQEALRAFAVDARTFVISYLDYYKSYLFDVDNGTNCQTYHGINRVNENVILAVTSTAGLINTYQGTVAKTFYSSSHGGSRSNIADVWGGASYPYLGALVTPWEKQDPTRSHAVWKKEYTPAALAKRLRDRGYTGLTGDVASVTVDQYSEGSAYVKQVTVTDTNGNTVVVRNTDKIRTVFGLDSANFVVGKAGETVQRTVYSLQGYPASDADQGQGDKVPRLISMQAESGSVTALSDSELFAMTPEGKKKLDASSALWVQTESGVFKFDTYRRTEAGTKLPLTEKSGLLDFSKLPVIVSTEDVTLEGTAGSFVFDGAGWGHGAGSSQWGYYDLAVMGYTYDEIIGFYYRGTEIKPLGSIQ